MTPIEKPKRKYVRKKTVTSETEFAVPRKTPTRKEVIQFINCYGAKAFYSGKQRKLFITNPKHRGDIEEKVISQFGSSLPFKLDSNSIQ